MTFGVQMLLIINIGIYAAERFLGIPLKQYGALQSDWFTHFSFWQLITYQFLHQGIPHLLFNMLGLYFLGPETERTLGTNRFLSLYFLSGILGGIGWSLISRNGSCVGASGAIFGILGAYAALYPNRKLVLLIFPFAPIKSWVLVLLLGAYEFIHIVIGPSGDIANAAHLSGGIAGYIYATLIGRPDIVRKLKRKMQQPEKPPVDRYEIDRILDKAAKHGMQTLSRQEKARLKQAAKK